jgi:tRNA modification GTPase
VFVAGPNALSAVADCFTPASGRPLQDLPIGRIALGRWGGPEGEELIVCRRSPDEIEVHCHGGLAAVNAVVERLVKRGCRQMFWEDWLRRTLDAIQADAQIALAKASTARTAAILLDQYCGALRAAVVELSAGIRSGDWPRAKHRISEMLAYREVGLHLTSPWRVVIAGPPNVGKSSLINALAGYQRSIVSHEAGTTRDVVTTRTAIGGWPVQLADTAGLRSASDELESAGIALAQSAVADADLVVIVREATTPSNLVRDTECVPDEFVAPPGAMRLIDVINKIDLVPAANLMTGHEPECIATSALTGAGLPELVSAIGRTLVPAPPPAGAAVPFTSDHVAALDSACAAINAHDAATALAALQPLLALISRV